MSKFMMEVDSLDTASVTRGGYDKEIFVEKDLKILQKYECTICKNILKDAFQFIGESNVPSRACLSCFTANTR